MTDDEAFVRAVVARPGDDLTRLVYADWLDERGDPRGTYLRAENAWAAGPRTDPPPAGGLDPVWVARVSRPPAGVCCDSVLFDDAWPIATWEGIDRVENQLGCRFPAEYRAFLLNYNGGVPTPNETPQSDDYLFVTIARFYAVSALTSPSGLGLASEVSRYRERLPAWLRHADPETSRADLEAFWTFVPVAQLYNDIFEIVIGPTGGQFDGQLILVDWTVGPLPIGYYNIPDRLPKLLSLLTITN